MVRIHDGLLDTRNNNVERVVSETCSIIMATLRMSEPTWL